MVGNTGYTGITPTQYNQKVNSDTDITVIYDNNSSDDSYTFSVQNTCENGTIIDNNKSKKAQFNRVNFVRYSVKLPNNPIINNIRKCYRSQLLKKYRQIDN